MEPAHRVADDDRPIDSGGVEDRDRVGDEVGGGVARRRASALAMPARVRRDQAQAARDGVREEIPGAAVGPDAVQQQGRRPVAWPGPVHELDARPCRGPACRHARILFHA